MTLQEKLKKSQSLTAQKSTAELAKEQGLPAAPVTAVATGAMGATPQQQAMAGTPAQKGAVLEKITAPKGETGFELAQKIRPAAAQDQAKQQELQKYSQSLGTYGDKINQWIEGALAATTAKEGGIKATLTTTPEQQKTIDDAKKNLPPDQQTALDAALNVLKTQGQSQDAVKNAIFDLNRLLGKTTTSSLLSGTAYKTIFDQDIAGQVGEQLETGIQAAARGPDSKLTLQDINTLGTTPEELRDLLNLPPNVNPLDLSLGEMQNRLAQVQQEAFGEVQAAQAGRSSALLSGVEKEALRNTVLQLEEAGIAGAEQQFQNLLDDIDAGTMVNIAGTDYTVEELLSDDTISSIADKYYAGLPADKAWLENLKKTEPALVEWLESNRNGLQIALAAGAGQADALVATNTELDKQRSLFDGTGILEAAGAGANFKTGTVVPTGTILDWNSVNKTVADIVNTKGPAQINAVKNLSNAIAAIPDNLPNKAELTQELLNTGFDALRLGDVNSPAIGNFIGSMALYDSFNSAGSPEEKLNMIFVDDRSLEQINSILAEDRRRAGMGLPTSSYFQYDANKDGQLTDDEINAILSKVKPPTVKDAVAGKTFAYNALDSALPPSLEGTDKILFDFLADGTVTPDELDRLSVDQLAELFEKQGRPGEGGRPAEGPVAGPVREAYLRSLDKAAVTGFESVGLAADGLPPDWEQKMAPQLGAKPANYPQAAWDEALSMGRVRNQIAGYGEVIATLRQLAKDTTNKDIAYRINLKADEFENAQNMAKQTIAEYDSRPGPTDTYFEKALGQPAKFLKTETGQLTAAGAALGLPGLAPAGKAIKNIKAFG